MILIQEARSFWSFALFDPDGQNVSIFSGNGVSMLIVLTSIRLSVALLVLSESLTEPSIYESQTKSIQELFLQMPNTIATMFSQSSPNVLRLVHRVLHNYAITSIMYAGLHSCHSEHGL